jgi:hypothetical protein
MLRLLSNTKGFMTTGKWIMYIVVIAIAALIIGFLIGNGTIPTPFTAPSVS